MDFRDVYERLLIWLPVDVIDVDPLVQRPQIEAHISAIADNFRPELFDPILVTRRADGRYSCNDGQQRLAGAKRRGVHEVPCRLTNLTDVADEADLFLDVQSGRRPVDPWSRWRIGLVGNKNCAREVEEICKMLDIEPVAEVRGPMQFSVGWMASTFKRNGSGAEVLATVAEFLANVFPADGEPWKAPFRRAATETVRRFLKIEELDRERLYEKARTVGWCEVNRLALTLRVKDGLTYKNDTMAYLEVLRTIYNEGLTKGDEQRWK